MLEFNRSVLMRNLSSELDRYNFDTWNRCYPLLILLLLGLLDFLQLTLSFCIGLLWPNFSYFGGSHLTPFWPSQHYKNTLFFEILQAILLDFEATNG